MKVRLILIVLATIAFVAVTTTLARQQPGGAPQPTEGQRTNMAGAAVADLRAKVARLRAEIELLELEHEVDKAKLFEMLKDQRQTESDSDRGKKARGAANEVLWAFASFGKLDEAEEKFGDESTLAKRLEQQFKEQDEKRKGEREQKKKGFLTQSTELNEKRLALADLERQLADIK